MTIRLQMFVRSAFARHRVASLRARSETVNNNVSFSHTFVKPNIDCTRATSIVLEPTYENGNNSR